MQICVVELISAAGSLAEGFKKLGGVVFLWRFVVNTLLKHSGMARILKESHSSTCIPQVHPLTEWTIPAFAFPAEAGTRLC